MDNPEPDVSLVASDGERVVFSWKIAIKIPVVKADLQDQQSDQIVPIVQVGSVSSATLHTVLKWCEDHREQATHERGATGYGMLPTLSEEEFIRDLCIKHASELLSAANQLQLCDLIDTIHWTQAVAVVPKLEYESDSEDERRRKANAKCKADRKTRAAAKQLETVTELRRQYLESQFARDNEKMGCVVGWEGLEYDLELVNLGLLNLD